MPPIIATLVGARLTLHIQPRARRTEAAGRHGDAIKVRVAAPPVDGEANAALIEWLASTLGVPRRAVTLVAGESGRRKVVDVTGVDVRTARTRLGLDDG